MLTPAIEDNRRLTILSMIFLLAALVIIAKLFVLQVVQHNYYSTLALSSHEIYKKIHPARGEIFFRDARTGEETPAAVNTKQYLVYAVPKEIEKGQTVDTAQKLVAVLGVSDEEKQNILNKISKDGDPYEPLAKKIPSNKADEIENMKLKGIYLSAEDSRYYPEGELASTVLGFYGFDSDGNPRGSYGLEGYWEKDLAGKSGLMLGERGAKGGWITLAGMTTKDAENGVNLALTIDRSLEYKACERLRQGMEENKARSASLVMMDPQTGAILAMCSFPDFDPNNYSKVGSAADFNNTTIFTPYEPGSVFKAITMASAIDDGLVNPNTTFVDPCFRKIDKFEIRNAEDKCYGTQTMTGVLEHSINTGVIWVQEKLGNELFHKYADKFGFGQKTGIGLETEMAGDISSLTKKSQIYGAVGAFGQGLTATPLQLAVAYSALANGGKVMKPYVVAEERLSNGKVVKTQPEITDHAISAGASKLITGMLVSVIENTYYRVAKLDHYYLAGKTGTAQIAKKNGTGYEEYDTNHTFAGYGPASNPRVVLIVKYEAPQSLWAESTAAPVFRDVMKFTLDYLGVPKER